MSVQEAASTKAEQRTGQIRCKESRRSHPRLNLSTDGKFRNLFYFAAVAARVRSACTRRQ
jgi:hypothetical protein